MKKRENKPGKIHKLCSERTINFFNRYSLVFHWIIALCLCFFIEAVSRHSVMNAVEFTLDRSWVFLYNSSIIFATFLIVYFFKRRTLIRVLLCGFWVLLGTINGCLLLKRVTPFGYTDLKLVKDLFAMQNNSYFSFTEALIVVVCVGAFALLNIWLWKFGPKYKGKVHYISNTILVLSCFIWIPAATHLAKNSNLLTDYFANIAQGYEKYGFVYGFSTSVVDRGMSQPKNYTQEAIENIQDDIVVPETKLKAGEGPNIIVVLLESFIDPYEINFLKLSKDPIPNFRRLYNEYSSGYCKVPVVGAGTANTEFEVLTGMSMRFFGTGEYPYKTVLKTNTSESIAGDLKNIGYKTHVVHNNSGNFYSRANAFSKMGFDSFTSKELMNIQEYTPIGTWATDDILLGEVEKSMDSTPGQSDLVYTITVEAHGDYPKEKVLENPAITVAGAESEEMNNAWEYYVNQLHNVDEFIGDLIDQLSKRDEDTMVVMFGDHLPTMGLEAKDMKSKSLFKTNYITWNNFGLEKKDRDLHSYELLAEITDQIGIHEGTIFTYHQNRNKDSAFMESYEKLQYDILYGKKYAYKGEDMYPASQLVMGVEEVAVDSAERTADGKILVTGQNYTPWSKVFVNGERFPTSFVDENRLLVSRENLDVGDIIVVNQLGSKSTIFRSSNSFVYGADYENKEAPPMLIK